MFGVIEHQNDSEHSGLIFRFDVSKTPLMTRASIYYGVVDLQEKTTDLHGCAEFYVPTPLLGSFLFALQKMAGDLSTLPASEEKDEPDSQSPSGEAGDPPEPAL